MSIHVVVGLVSVKRFDHEGLHQLKKCFVTDEDPRGRNVLLNAYTTDNTECMYSTFILLHGHV